MAEVTYRDAVAMAIAQEMRRDPNVVFLGEDIAAAGGVFKATVGLLDEFGPLRVRDTPISEQAILGAAMGAAMTGLRPIAEIMFLLFKYLIRSSPPGISGATVTIVIKSLAAEITSSISDKLPALNCATT